MTRYRDSEGASSSIYAQGDPWEPVVNFEDYINNEDIVNKVQRSTFMLVLCIYRGSSTFLRKNHI